MRIAAHHYLEQPRRRVRVLLLWLEEEGDHRLLRLSARLNEPLGREHESYRGSVADKAAAGLRRLEQRYRLLAFEPIDPLPTDVDALLDEFARRGESITPGRPTPGDSYPPRLAWPTLVGGSSLPRGGQRAQQGWPWGTRALCVISSRGRVVLAEHLDGEDTVFDVLRVDSASPHSALLARLANGYLPLAGTTFDGVALLADGQPRYWVSDLLRYRGSSTQELPLWERSQLLDQALAELSAAGRLHPGWARLPLTAPNDLPLGSLGVVTLRDLDSPYPGDDDQAWVALAEAA